MLDVWCVLWGEKYSADYVRVLKAMIERHLKTQHRFRCVTNKVIDGVDTVNPIKHWHGWWQKLTLFELARGRSLYFDLDVVITGELDYLVPYTRNVLAAPANWGQSGHGGIQSSVMAWNGTLREPYERFDYDVDSKRLWGDQEFLSEMYGENYTKLPGIYSYKYHCTTGLPTDCSVAVFHGKPDPHEVNDAWVKAARSTSIQPCPTRSNLASMSSLG